MVGELVVIQQVLGLKATRAVVLRFFELPDHQGFRNASTAGALLVPAFCPVTGEVVVVFGYIMAAIVMAMVAMPARAEMVLEGPARVIDGDTIEIKGQRIRLHGIDAPESRQQCLDQAGYSYACGKAATESLRAFLLHTPVKCLSDSYDRYKRLIAIREVQGTNINAWMVKSGWALAYRKYSKDYIADEDEARTSVRGIWSGTFIEPWRWRRGDRLQSTN